MLWVFVFCESCPMQCCQCPVRSIIWLQQCFCSSIPIHLKQLSLLLIQTVASLAMRACGRKWTPFTAHVFFEPTAHTFAISGVSYQNHAFSRWRPRFICASFMLLRATLLVPIAGMTPCVTMAVKTLHRVALCGIFEGPANGPSKAF